MRHESQQRGRPLDKARGDDSPRVVDNFVSVPPDTHRALADLAMRAIDTIAERCANHEHELVGACLVFEVRMKDENGDDHWNADVNALDGMGPFHAVGLLRTCADHIAP